MTFVSVSARLQSLATEMICKCYVNAYSLIVRYHRKLLVITAEVVKIIAKCLLDLAKISTIVIQITKCCFLPWLDWKRKETLVIVVQAKCLAKPLVS